MFTKDRDGYVSQEDFKLSKKFDFNGNGVLDPEERHIGQTILADEFFKRNENQLFNYGPKIATNTHHTNVNNLVNAFRFALAVIIYRILLTIISFISVLNVHTKS